MVLCRLMTGVLMLVFTFYCSGLGWGQTVVRTHDIEANHPAFERADPLPFDLQELEEDGQPIFQLEVESVICADHLCKIVPVRMYWDRYGQYVRYELPEGVYLEKGEGEPFEKQEYDVLHEILQDEASPYSYLTYHEVTHEQVMGEGQVDAISGATTIILDKGQSVVGATWTCFTLWHWANGDVNKEVRRITGARAGTQQLIDLLNTTKKNKREYALTEIIRRKASEPTVVKKVIELAQIANKQLVNQSVSYLETLDELQYLQSLEQLYDTERNSLRLEILRSLLRTNVSIAETSICRFIDLLPGTADYQEVNYLLLVIEKQQLSSAMVAEKLLPLLDAADFLVSRRAYYYLSQVSTDQRITDKVAAYFARYSDRL